VRNFGACKCGYISAFGSDPPAPCDPCEKCNTVPGGRDPIPHDFRAQGVATDEGPKSITRCIRCMKTKAKIEAEEAARVKNAPAAEGGAK
jgi:hypothetical protein